MQEEHNFNQFYQAHQRRIHFQIHRLAISNEWYGQFHQEGIIALWNAYKDFDETKGDFGTYLNYTIRYRLLDLLRAKMRRQESEARKLEEQKTVLDDGNRHKGTEQPILTQHDIHLQDSSFWDAIKEHLNDNQWKWVQYFIIAELSIKEIMEIEDVTSDTVKSWGRAVRKKLNKPEIQAKLTSMLER